MKRSLIVLWVLACGGPAAPPEELAVCCDVPACKADPYYVQKLAVTLAAWSKPTWKIAG